MDMDMKPLPYEYLKNPSQNGLSTAPVVGQPMSSQAPPNPVVITAAPPIPLGRVPQRMTCPYCHIVMMTRLDQRATKNTHLMALGLCVVGLICLAPMPYCMKSCMSLDHYCTNCNQFVGKAAN
ncbi:lipopolysaccharide-induced tumor necrosis factor-alpha factor homolog [Drosophila busckii]|uniref:lipopolysaccharide-induced tumor necrosis factor-alpha factor homolog n=1 Tax=Drosophila busckii TaxID=30019 RepID=UPI00083EE6C8|nr:lipopolysaccharide-induced tumor necrosis factor-alpha factor homolog [Drosophila busckii]